MDDILVPRALKPLLYPARYKGAYGGRGGAKSHFFAEQALVKGYCKPTRIVCIREVQDSIRDSVRQLLVDKISKLGMTAFWRPLDSEIRGANGSLIIFKGMQSYNAETIKSLEAYDIAWVEEAQTLSQRSLDMLRPTIRKEGSELWFSWNPRYKTDPVDVFFRRSPPAEAVSVLVNWRDNPWFPDVLRRDMERDIAVDPVKADHTWNGAYGASEGSILSRWVSEAEREGRVNDLVRYDELGNGIAVSGDLGFRDTAAWWYWQRKVGGFSLLAYDGDSGLDADDWIPRIQEKLRYLGGARVKLERIWLPHDARAKTFQSKYSSMEKFLTAFGHEKVTVVPQTKKADQISAARRVIKRCEFSKIECEAGLDGLMAWEFEWNDDNNVFSREPLHNWASHPGDSFAYGAQMMEEAQQEQEKDDASRFVAVAPYAKQTVTLNDMWTLADRENSRTARI
jgi:phage terminase large subunit